MEFRNHPLMRFHGVPTWPPVWSNTTPMDHGKTDRGEIGVLKDCHCNPVVKNICFMFVEHAGQSYVGALVVDDPVFCQQVFSVLRHNIGRRIKEIGSLDLSHTL